MKTPADIRKVIGTKGSELTGRTRDILLAIVAISALWSWNTCLLFLPVFHAAPLGQHTTWLTTGFATAILYLAAGFGSRRFARLQAKAAARATFTAIMTLATAAQVLIAYTPDQLAVMPDLGWQALHFARSLGSVPCAVLLAFLLSTFPSMRERSLIVFTGTVLNPLIYLLVDNLAPVLAGLVTCLLPVLVFASMEKRMRRTTVAKPAEDGHVLTTSKLMLAAYFVFGLSINFIRGTVERSSDTVFSNSSVIAFTFVLVLAAIALALASRREVVLYATVVYFTLAIFLSVNGVSGFALPLVTARMFLYLAVFWLSAQADAQKVPGSIIRTFSFGFGVYGMGLALGAVLSRTLPSTSASVQAASLAVAYALFLAGAVITKAARREKPKPVPVVAARGSRAMSDLEACLEKYCDQLADGHDLTSQEKRVLFELACSKSLKAIADDFGVSLNTVKTHTSHIYRKLDVHSREELMHLVIEQSKSAHGDDTAPGERRA